MVAGLHSVRCVTLYNKRRINNKLDKQWHIPKDGSPICALPSVERTTKQQPLH